MKSRQCDGQAIAEKNMEVLARAMSQGTSDMKSCFLSIKTPFTQKSGKSQITKKTGGTGVARHTICDNWYQDRQPYGSASVTKSVS